MSELLGTSAVNETPNFGLQEITEGEGYGIDKFNENMETIDREMAKPPLTFNGIEPDPGTRDMNVTTIPLADNLTSDEAQINNGTFIVRTAGGESSIASGNANIADIRGDMVKTGYVPLSEKMTVNSETFDATIDWSTFEEAVSVSGTTTLTYSGSWSANPATYGITIDGTPANGDSIVIEYVKENRGVITAANPSSFVATGWNLYNHAAGYARVVNYSDEYGYMIDGTYTKLEFAETLTGAKQTINPVNGYFVVPADGYVFVTGGNGTDTEIWLTWSDWTDEANGGVFEPYTQSQIDLSGLMVSFPNGLMKVGNYADEINFNTQRAISRIERIPYTAENLETVISYGVPYDTDTNYIFYVKTEPDVFIITIDGEYSVSDHGLEMFIGSAVPVTLYAIYGQDLKGKLRRDVLTISKMDLTDPQKLQACQNIGAVPSSVFDPFFETVEATKDRSSNFTWGNSYVTGDSPTGVISAWGKIRAIKLTIHPKNANAAWTVIGTLPSAHRPTAYQYVLAMASDGSETRMCRINASTGEVSILNRSTKTYYINFIYLVS